MNVKIVRSIVHIVDMNSGALILSQSLTRIDDEFNLSYVERNIRKLYSDNNTKTFSTYNENSLYTSISYDDDDFKQKAILIAQKAYNIQCKSSDAVSFDLIISEAYIDEIPHICFIKLNHRTGCVHNIEYSNEGVGVQLLEHKALLPSRSQIADDVLILNLLDGVYIIREKLYTFDGEKKYYFSDLFIGYTAPATQKESVKIVRDVANTVAREKSLSVTKIEHDMGEAIYDSLETGGQIDVLNIAQIVFSDDDETQERFVTEVAKSGVGSNVKFYGSNPEKKYSKIRIKTDAGIEIAIPIDIYRSKELVEFTTNLDGTTSIKINKITNYQSK